MTLAVTNLEGDVGTACGKVARRPQVLIVSGMRLYREATAAMLAATGRVEIVGMEGGTEPSSGTAPDVVLLDIDCLSSPAGAPALNCPPTAKIVAFGVSNVEHEILACAKAGVSGMIEKNGSAEDVLATIEGVVRGEVPCPARIAGTLLQCLTAIVHWHAHRPNVAGLSSREVEVIELIDRGWSNKRIARQLGISAATVKNHVHKILEKLQVRRRAEAAAAMRSIGAASARSMVRHWSALLLAAPAVAQLPMVYPL
ncbi:MAG: LuxR C-terminal-related transcriptional regulator [Reyranella sp.]|uniref:LuxR C-terminal-related transcriptional regulator n=1 Tax=Reyranella sp. TaxID=1929291 RepID=UPI003D0DBA17